MNTGIGLEHGIMFLAQGYIGTSAVSIDRDRSRAWYYVSSTMIHRNECCEYGS